MSDRPHREQLTARQLAEQGDTTVRTVHYYVAEGLLPPPEGATRGAAYTSSHLARLQIIAALRSEGLSLAAIRSRIEQLGDDEVEMVLETLERYAGEIAAGEVTALGLIEAAVVSSPDLVPPILETSESAPAPYDALPPLAEASPPDSARAYVERMLRRTGDPRSPERRRDVTPRPRQRPETWHHFVIDDGIEIRVREDRLRPERREIETFIDSVQDLARRGIARRSKSDRNAK